MQKDVVAQLMRTENAHHVSSKIKMTPKKKMIRGTVGEKIDI